MKFNIGDSVIVKNGILDPDEELYDMSGWQGRIIEDYGEKRENDSEEILHFIQWDSITLRNLPEGFVLAAIIYEESYKSMYLYESDLIAATPRDTEEEVKAALEEVEDFYRWACMDESGERIFHVLKHLGAKPDKEKAIIAWKKHIVKTLPLPCKVIYAKDGKEYSLISIGKILKTSGILGTITRKQQRLDVPLIDLEPVKISTANQVLGDYEEWFFEDFDESE